MDKITIKKVKEILGNEPQIIKENIATWNKLTKFEKNMVIDYVKKMYVEIGIKQKFDVNEETYFLTIVAKSNSFDKIIEQSKLQENGENKL